MGSLSKAQAGHNPLEKMEEAAEVYKEAVLKCSSKQHVISFAIYFAFLFRCIYLQMCVKPVA